MPRCPEQRNPTDLRTLADVGHGAGSGTGCEGCEGSDCVVGSTSSGERSKRAEIGRRSIQLASAMHLPLSAQTVASHGAPSASDERVCGKLLRACAHPPRPLAPECCVYSCDAEALQAQDQVNGCHRCAIDLPSLVLEHDGWADLRRLAGHQSSMALLSNLSSPPGCNSGTA